MYLAVTEENSRKNLVFGLLEESIPGMLPENYSWAFGASPGGGAFGNRVLHVTIGRPITTGQKTAIQAAVDARFGPGLVMVS